MHRNPAATRRFHPAHGAVPLGGTLLLACALLAPGCHKAPPEPGAGVAANEFDAPACAWAFQSYEPSPWEAEWRRGEESGQRRDRECEILAQKEEVDRSVRLIAATADMLLNNAPMPPKGALPLYSRMVYARRCGAMAEDTGQRRVQLIEPLVGILRDPLTICPRPPGVPDELYKTFASDESTGQSKRHLLPGPLAPWTDTPDDPESWRVGGFEPAPAGAVSHTAPRPPQRILLDLGASLYNGWQGNRAATGASWFVDRFKRHQLAFDWILSFEIEKHGPDEIYRSVPDDVLPHYVYYNQGVESAPNGRWNPWRILKGMSVTPEDYVVVKLDIDVYPMENALIDQLSRDARTLQLVDEIFYEQHVNVKAMWNLWRTQKEVLTTKDSYQLFSNLRAKGVRAHSWP